MIRIPIEVSFTVTDYIEVEEDRHELIMPEMLDVVRRWNLAHLGDLDETVSDVRISVQRLFE